MSVLSSSQYRFRNNYSTYMALIDLEDNLSQSIDKNKYTIGIFVNVSKAFDAVDHKILMGNSILWHQLCGSKIIYSK